MDPRFTTIETKTRLYAGRKAALNDIMGDLKAEMDAACRKASPRIKRSVGLVAEALDDLKAELEANPELFVKPRTQTYEGYKVGYTKSRDTLEWEDDAHVIKLIRKHIPEEKWPLLIKTEESVSKEALKGLEPAELKQIGVKPVAGEDKVVVTSVDAAIDKAMAAMMKEAEEHAFASRKEAA